MSDKDREVGAPFQIRSVAIRHLLGEIRELSHDSEYKGGQLIQGITKSPQLLAPMEELLHLTFDQLRTLVIIANQRSYSEAGAILNKTQSTVQKQHEMIEAKFRDVAGEQLIKIEGPPKRREFTLTPAGRHVVELAEVLCNLLLYSSDDLRLSRGRLIRAGATTFMLPMVLQFWDEWRQLVEPKYMLSLDHIKSDHVQRYVIERHGDFAFGSIIAQSESEMQKQVNNGAEFMCIATDDLGLLTNLPQEELSEPVDPTLLLKDAAEGRLDFILPDRGIIWEFAKRVFDSRYLHEHHRRISWSNDVWFGLTALKLGIHKGCMIAHRQAATWANNLNFATSPKMKTGAASHASKRKSKGESSVIREDRSLRWLKFTEKTPLFVVYAGLFRRIGEASDYASEHPVNSLWRHFSERSERPDDRSTGDITKSD